MESLRSSAAAKVLLALNKKGKLYTTELSYEIRVSARHLSLYVLPKMVKDNLVKSYKEKNRIYYELTELGKVIALALEDPRYLAALYKLGETAKNKELFRIVSQILAYEEKIKQKIKTLEVPPVPPEQAKEIEARELAELILYLERFVPAAYEFFPTEISVFYETAVKHMKEYLGLGKKIAAFKIPKREIKDLIDEEKSLAEKYR
ncbi:MAG: winged helix-turn-helix domain-containing protein [Candidatus Aenigmatarchaeota archaeon]